MAKKPESVFRARIYSQLLDLPKTVLFPIQQRSIRGDPDFLLCCNGRFAALELKKDGKSKLTKLQAYKLEQIDKCGGMAFVVTPENWNVILRNLKLYIGD